MPAREKVIAAGITLLPLFLATTAFAGDPSVPDSSPLSTVKTVVEILSGVVTFMAAVWAAMTFRRKMLTEHAQWVTKLYEKFYEKENLKEIREILDRPVDQHKIDVVTETSALSDDARTRRKQQRLQSKFADYLNF